VTAAFEDWPPPEEPFDAVVSATAFHRIDPAARLDAWRERCAPAARSRRRLHDPRVPRPARHVLGASRAGRRGARAPLRLPREARRPRSRRPDRQALPLRAHRGETRLNDGEPGPKPGLSHDCMGVAVFQATGCYLRSSRPVET
jgi:hypothetical protein